MGHRDGEEEAPKPGWPIVLILLENFLSLALAGVDAPRHLLVSQLRHNEKGGPPT